jgi:hypothetical protein
MGPGSISVRLAWPLRLELLVALLMVPPRVEAFRVEAPCLPCRLCTCLPVRCLAKARMLGEERRFDSSGKGEVIRSGRVFSGRKIFVACKLERCVVEGGPVLSSDGVLGRRLSFNAPFCFDILRD